MGDIDRIKRQQKLVKAMLCQLKESGRLVSSIGIVMKYIRYIKTDTNIVQLAGLVSQYNNAPVESCIEYYEIPGEEQVIDGMWYWIPNEEGKRRVLDEFFQIF